MSGASLIRDSTSRDEYELREALLQSAPVGLMALDPDGMVSQWNEEAERLLGWSEEAIVGLPFPPLAQIPAVAELLDRAAEQGEARATLGVRGADGALVPLELRVRTVLAKGGLVIGSAWTMREAAPEAAAVQVARRGGAEWVAGQLRGAVATSASSAEITDRIRATLAAGVHLGFLHAGEPLPSIRAMASLTGVDHRAIASAVRLLEGEGWVRVRERRGIFLADHDQEAPHLGETGDWLARVLSGARDLKIRLPVLPSLLQRMTAARPLRCGCVESTEDDLFVLCTELRRSWGLETTPLRVGDGAPIATSVRLAAELRAPRQAPALDLLVSTPFHAALARDLARRLDLPVLVLTLDPEIVAAIEARLRAATLTAIVADAAFGERLLAVPGAAGGRLRVLLADDADALAALDPDEPVLLTGAARERVGDHPFRLLVPADLFLSAASAAQLAAILIHHNTAPRPATAAAARTRAHASRSRGGAGPRGSEALSSGRNFTRY
jgi:PAS domain S-box-containing protein